MKSNFKLISAITLFLFPFLLLSQTEKKKSNHKPSIFSQSDASNWEYIIKDASLNPSAIFKMEDGILKISGVSSGYLRTIKSSATTPSNWIGDGQNHLEIVAC